MSLIRPHLFSLAAVVALALTDVSVAQLPQVDFDRMGKVGLAGSFAGLEVFDNSSVAFDPSTSTILSRGSDGSLTRLASTNSGGVVSASCTLGDTVYFGGSFSNIDGVSASNVASYTPSSDSFSALSSGEPNGDVYALYCDEKNKKVWAGGRFTTPSRAVAVWDANAKSWSAPPFVGLTGAAGEVLSITTNSSAESLFFAGSFITSFSGNVTSLNNTNNPNVPFSPGATPFSSSLVPVPLGGAQIVAQPSSADSQFSDIHNILCPSGDDGPGQTWFAADSNTAVITARAFSFISSGGIRLGNTFLDGHGTTGFSVTTIPDNAVRTLRYIDPTTGQNQTCSNDCPLLRDKSIPYQDFLFDGPLNITGVQVTLSKWTGTSPGLHLFQLLSSGAFAVAVNNQNGQSCFAPAASDATFTGTWVQKDAFTTLPGTTQSVLVSSVDVGAAPAADPSFTWRPYVSAAGRYTLSLLVPGCANFADCPLRTSVKVTVFPGGGQRPWVTTVDQRNTQDAATVVYEGPIVPTPPNYFATVTMSIADQPAGTGQNGKYTIVADRVQLVLNQADVNGTTSNGNGTNGTGGVRSGFGFFEWPISGGQTVNATAVLPNTTESALDALSLALFNGLRGGNASLTPSSAPAISSVVHHSSGTIFLGGNFTLSSGAANVVSFKNGALVPLADNGVDGPVKALALNGDKLFVGGSFGKSASGGTTSRGVMLYDIGQNKWSALEDGVDGAVISLAFDDKSRLQVTGNFTRALTSATSSIPAGGLATWDAQNGTWVSSGGFLVGSMNFVSNATSAKGLAKAQFVAGSVTTSLKYGTSGFVMLSNGDEDKNGGVPEITPLGVQLDGVSNASATRTTTSGRKRAHASRSWMPTFSVPHIFSRQSTSGNGQQASNASIAGGPSVAAGAFWTNSSSGDEITILGGNFSFASGSARNVAIYDPKTGAINALRGAQPSGIVNTLYVDGDTLYIGGQFTLEGTSVNGLAIYNLARQTWVNDGLQGLRAADGKDVVVRSITTSASKQNTIVLAGTFLGAGSLTCNAICAMDTSTKDFSALGTGIQGDVVNVAYAGDKQDILIASGTISLSDSTPANVAQYSFSGGSWSAVGPGLPGPVTALEVNNGNASSIFAAGRASDGNNVFISFWNGAQWSSLSTTLQGSSNVTSMTMVPVRDDHDANGIIEKDRMLLVSGSLAIGAGSGNSKRADPEVDNASSALFDGVKFIPYLVSSSSSGGSGSVSSLIHSFKTYSFNRRRFLATGIVILISIAIAAGIVFLLVLIGIIWSLLSRRDDKGVQYTEEEDDDSSVQHRPTSLLAHINAATRNTILGTNSPFNNFNAEKDAAAAAALAGASSHGHGQGTEEAYARPDTPSDTMGVALGGDAEDQGRPARARYSFDGKEEGELPLTSGLDVVILDDRDPSWWYAMDPRTGREGVIPSNYVV